MTVDGKIEIHRGLRGVYFERSATTFIDGKAGELRYRGYSIHDLAQKSTFEETAYLLLHGELPTAAQLAAITADLKAARQIPGAVVDIIRTLAHAHPWMCSAPPFRRSPPSILWPTTIPSTPRAQKAFA